MDRFSGRTAVVTGGASGIGAATARRLAAEGARVAVLDIDKAAAAGIAAELGGLAVAVDVADPQQVAEAIRAVEEEFGAIDVLIANAGGSGIGFFVDTTPQDWNEVMAVNLLGVMASVHAVLPGMIRRRGGSVVVTASEAGRVGTVGGAAYGAAKAGAIGFTKSIAREGARYGIRCNAIAAGPIDTPLLRSLDQDALGLKIHQAMLDSTMLGRAGTPQEVAAAIAFLASADASYLTGHTLSVSGGLMMG